MTARQLARQLRERSESAARNAHAFHASAKDANEPRLRGVLVTGVEEREPYYEYDIAFDYDTGSAVYRVKVERVA